MKRTAHCCSNAYIEITSPAWKITVRVGGVQPRSLSCLGTPLLVCQSPFEGGKAAAQPMHELCALIAAKAYPQMLSSHSVLKMHTTTILTGAAFAAAVSVASQYATTATMPGLTLTLPAGLSTSTTKTVSPKTVTGKAAVVSGVTAIVDSSPVYFLDGSKFALSTPASTTIVTTGSTTVTTTNSMGSTIVSTNAVTTTSTSRPNAGERAYRSVPMLWAGAAVGAAAVANY
ncbi:hypothetical protein Micbo1qcDRAFT_179248 [Microdochium bolleyi]|uniref:Uncharacterized protein n=1 Tax=Microdochium bolleyi TaxID=196109 RepID=A0A136IR30_9PEZI|nr:hypothetical protein Micbo1qcDRAFT_179248 [Microdochium bolleyi]